MMTDSRCYGLDLFRLTAMVMITAIHINMEYFVLVSSWEKSIWLTGWLIQNICFAGVNCFALLTGYLARETRISFDKKWFSRIFDLWAKVVIFGLLIYFPVLYLLPDIEFRWRAIYYIFCVRGGVLWYIGAYLGLLVFLPFISGFTARFSVREQALFCLISFGLFSVLTITNSVPESFHLAKGYSMIWLIICYLWGQALRAAAPMILKWKFSTLVLLAGAVAGIAVPFFYLITTGGWRLMNYVSPFFVLEAACLLLLFSKIQIKGEKTKKVLKFLSTYSLGIYLLQAQHVVWFDFLCKKNRFPEEPLQILWKFPAMILGTSIIGVLVYFLSSKIYSIRIFSWIRDFIYSVFVEKFLKFLIREK